MTARRTRAALVGVLAVVLVGVLGTAGVLWWTERAEDDATPEVLTAARTAATTFFTLDHTTIEDDLDAMAALSTGEFARTYAAEREDLARQVTSKELSITATVADAGAAVEQLRDDDATVLVAVDATTTSGGTEVGAEGGDEARYRLRVTLALVDDAWLVTDLGQVGLDDDPAAYEAGTVTGAPEGALPAAVDLLPVAFGYDHRTLDDDLAAATAGMTDAFAAEYTATFDGTVRPLATSRKAVAQAHVRAVGLVSSSGPEQAVVLAFLDQVLVSGTGVAAGEEPARVTRTRVLVGLREVDGTWLLASIDPF